MPTADAKARWGSLRERNSGRTWSSAYPTGIPNPGSKPRLINLPDTRIVLFHNPSEKDFRQTDRDDIPLVGDCPDFRAGFAKRKWGCPPHINGDMISVRLPQRHTIAPPCLPHESDCGNRQFPFAEGSSILWSCSVLMDGSREFGIRLHTARDLLSRTRPFAGCGSPEAGTKWDSCVLALTLGFDSIRRQWRFNAGGVGGIPHKDPRFGGSIRRTG
jgi:hypothetical protein